jgi:hypothetical protein
MLSRLNAYKCKDEHSVEEKRKLKENKRLLRTRAVIDLFIHCLYVSLKDNKFKKNRLRRERTTESRVINGYSRTVMFIMKTARRSSDKGLIALAKFWSINCFKAFANIAVDRSDNFIFIEDLLGFRVSKRFLATMYGLSRSISRGAAPNENMIEKYIEIMCTPSKPIQQALLKKLEDFTYNMIKKSSDKIVRFEKVKRQRVVDLKDLSSRVSIPLTACLELAVHEGGAREFLRKQMIWRHSGVGEAMNAKAHVRRWADTLSQEFQRCYLHWSKVSSDGRPIPFALPHAVSKPGGGHRIVTICNAGLVHSLAPVNGLLLRIIKQFPECRSNLEGKDPCSYLRVADDSIKCECYSADLTAASDHIPFAVAKAINEGIWRALNIAPYDPLRKLMNLASGPVSFVSFDQTKCPGRAPDLSNMIIPHLYSQRGLLMGMGLAWPYLNIINCFASRRSRDFRGSVARKERHSRDTLIAGDDLFGYWTRRRILRYESIMRRLDLKLNKTKTYKSPHTGLFTENIIEVKKRNFGLHNRPKYDKIKFEIYPRIYLSQISLAKNVDVSGRPRNLDLPVYRTIGPCLRQIDNIKVPKWQKERAFKAIESLHKKSINRLKRARIPLWLPTCLGGAGGPLNYRYKLSMKDRLTASLILSNTTREFRARAMNQIAYFWNNQFRRDPLGGIMHEAKSRVEDLPSAKHPSAVPKYEILKKLVTLINTESSLDPSTSIKQRHRHNVTYIYNKSSDRPKIIPHSLERYSRFVSRWKQHCFNLARGLRYPTKKETIASKLYDIEKLNYSDRVRKRDAELLIKEYAVPQVELFGRTNRTDHTPSESEQIERGSSYYRMRYTVLESVTDRFFKHELPLSRRHSVPIVKGEGRTPAPSYGYIKTGRKGMATGVIRLDPSVVSDIKLGFRVVDLGINKIPLVEPEKEFKFHEPPRLLEMKYEAPTTEMSEHQRTIPAGDKPREKYNEYSDGRRWDRDARGYDYEEIKTEKISISEDEPTDRQAQLELIRQRRAQKKLKKPVKLDAFGVPINDAET